MNNTDIPEPTTTTYTHKVAAAAEAKHDTTQHKKSQTKTVREVKHTQRQTARQTDRKVKRVSRC